MLRKLFVVAMVSFMSSSIFAGSHGNIFKAQGTCANKHSAMRMMGELPLHIGGEMNCSDQIQIRVIEPTWVLPVTIQDIPS